MISLSLQVCSQGGGSSPSLGLTTLSDSHGPPRGGEPVPDAPGTVRGEGGPSPRPIASCSPVPVRPPLTRLPPPPIVSEPPAALGALEKPPGSAILCTTCGSVCRGEVLRVQSQYFHLKCFVCKGECPARPAASSCRRPAGISSGQRADLGAWKPGSRAFLRECHLISVACVTPGCGRRPPGSPHAAAPPLRTAGARPEVPWAGWGWGVHSALAFWDVPGLRGRPPPLL